MIRYFGCVIQPWKFTLTCSRESLDLTMMKFGRGDNFLTLNKVLTLSLLQHWVGAEVALKEIFINRTIYETNQPFNTCQNVFKTALCFPKGASSFTLVETCLVKVADEHAGGQTLELKQWVN